MDPTPSIGRIVHFIDTPTTLSHDMERRHRPAIIVQVDGQRLLLTVFCPHPYSIWADPSSSDRDVPGTWHWPEREPS